MESDNTRQRCHQDVVGRDKIFEAHSFATRGDPPKADKQAGRTQSCAKSGARLWKCVMVLSNTILPCSRQDSKHLMVS